MALYLSSSPIADIDIDPIAEGYGLSILSFMGAGAAIPVIYPLRYSIDYGESVVS